MALVVNSVGSAGQQQTELRCWTEEFTTPELISGHLTMVSSMGNGTRHHRLAVFARLYRACSGRILVLWPDKLHSLPLGCVNLRDTEVSRHCTEDKAFILRHQSADGGGQPLTLACLSQDDYKRWETTLMVTAQSIADPYNNRRKLFTSSNVTRLPMLIEEEP